MHDSVLVWVGEQIGWLGPHRRGARVLEVGSADINGSVRPGIERALSPRSYLGLDIAPGPGVDIVCPGGVESFPGEDQFDLVVSCEMLEHAERWEAAFRAMVRLLRPGGVLLLTARGPGFPRHNPPDFWRFTPSDLGRAAVACGLVAVRAQQDPQVPGAFLYAVKQRMPRVMREPGAPPLE
jgi:SAM-dependent methyltransferase